MTSQPASKPPPVPAGELSATDELPASDPMSTDPMSNDGTTGGRIELSSRWIVLTQGTRPAQLVEALASIARHDDAPVTLAWNTEAADPQLVAAIDAAWGEATGRSPGDRLQHLVLGENLGIPGGRDAAIAASNEDVLLFLDDDAEVVGDWARRVTAEFADPRLGAVAFRIVDEAGESNREHIPKLGSAGAVESGPVPLFIGCGNAIRRDAYDRAGGYWRELFYAHEELDLSWRLYAHGYRVEYDADAVVRHPDVGVSRHAQGWYRTGRNRVMIARRNLPWPVAAAHVGTWLVGGLVRAPGLAAKRSYARGWLNGWRQPVERDSIGWSTVRRLGSVGRLPVT